MAVKRATAFIITGRNDSVISGQKK